MAEPFADRGAAPLADRRNQTPVFELAGVGRRFGTDPPVDALVDVNLAVRSGEWVSIAGPSGSGKSTLLNILGCLDQQTSGTFLFEGNDVASLSDRQRAGLRSRGIGFVFQAFHLLPHRTVLENVMLSEVYRHQTARQRNERARRSLDQVGLSHRADFQPTRLSGGERQRVAIARALHGQPRLLLCDEPTGNLDSTTSETILGLFEDLHHRGMTVVMITHERNVARRAQRQVDIIDGHLTENRR